MTYEYDKCEACKGFGRYIDALYVSRICPFCNGKGRVSAKKKPVYVESKNTGDTTKGS